MNCATTNEIFLCQTLKGMNRGSKPNLQEHTQNKWYSLSHKSFLYKQRTGKPRPYDESDK